MANGVTKKIIAPNAPGATTVAAKNTQSYHINVKKKIVRTEVNYALIHQNALCVVDHIIQTTRNAPFGLYTQKEKEQQTDQTVQRASVFEASKKF